jgi:CHASE3 domain sensor protein
MFGMSLMNKARLAFAAGIFLLVSSGLAASVIIVRVSQSAERIGHTYDVQVAIGEVDGTLATAARARFSYTSGGGDGYFRAFDAVTAQLTTDLQHVRELTKDNPTQQYLCTRLENLAHRRLDLLKSSIDLTKSGHSTESAQARFSRENVNAASDLVNVIHEMQDQEELSLGERGHLSGRRFEIIAAILCAGFILSMWMFGLHYKLLSGKIEELQDASSSGTRSPGPLKIESAKVPGNVYNLANKK